MIVMDLALQFGFVGVVILGAITLATYLPARKLRQTRMKKGMK